MRLPTRQSLLPFLRWLPSVNRKKLSNDALVGLTGAILALPQSIAYALIAGLPAESCDACAPADTALLWAYDPETRQVLLPLAPHTPTTRAPCTPCAPHALLCCAL